MRSQQQQTPPSTNFEKVQGCLNWLNLGIQGLAVSVEVFLHKGDSFGSRYMGLKPLAAAVIMFFFPALFEHEDPRPVWYFIVIVFVACAIVNGRARVRDWKQGPSVHSYYSGTPYLTRLFRRSSEEKIKTSVEPIFVWIVGLAILPMSVPLGMYLMLAGFGLMASGQLARRANHGRALDMNDAYLDQRNLVERWRNSRGD